MSSVTCPRGCVLGLERNLGYCVEGSANSDTSHHAQEVILVQFSHNLYVQKVSNTPVIRSLIHPFIFNPPPPMIYIINEFLKYYSNNYHFLNITETLSSMQGNTKGSY